MADEGVKWDGDIPSVRCLCQGERTIVPSACSVGRSYVRDPSGLDRFFDLESLYREIQKEKMSELQHVAYCLGAKYCKLEMHETQVSDSKQARQIKASVKKPAVASESEGISADRSEQVSEDRRMLFERRFSGSDEVSRPPLNWYKNDKEINARIEMRCSDASTNAIQDYVVNIDCRSSATLAQTRASEIELGIERAKGVDWHLSARGMLPRKPANHGVHRSVLKRKESLGRLQKKIIWGSKGRSWVGGPFWFVLFRMA